MQAAVLAAVPLAWTASDGASDELVRLKLRGSSPWVQRSRPSTRTVSSESHDERSAAACSFSAEICFASSAGGTLRAPLRFFALLFFPFFLSEPLPLCG